MIIFPCTVDRKPALCDLLYLYLAEVQANGGDLLSTHRNVEYFAAMAMEGGCVGDPCIMGYINDVAVGFHISRGLPDVLDTTHRICHGYGTYVLPTYRKLGLSKELRNHAFEIALVAGYTRLEGIAFGVQAAMSTFSLGSKPIGIVVVKDKEG